jgi:hypothetical protein
MISVGELSAMVMPGKSEAVQYCNGREIHCVSMDYDNNMQRAGIYTKKGPAFWSILYGKRPILFDSVR